jgi:UDP:flavonoid glycosyltransferase YjiC (YdhE family)
MPRVLFVPLPELGHILPTISVAHYLVSRGCEVIYFTAPQFNEVIRRAGASVIPMVQQEDIGKMYSAQHIWNQLIPMTGVMSGMDSKRRRLTGLLRNLMEQKPFAQVFLDRRIVTSYGCRVGDILDERRCLLFSTSLPNWNESERESSEPPILAFCPEELEIPKFRHRYAGLHYVEPSVRPDDEEGLEKVDSTRKLVLISFGSQSIRYRKLETRFAAVAELARRQPLLQFVLATGTVPSHFLGDLSTRPLNLVVYEQVPQRRLLDKASVFVTHGGLGSIKEAIMACVPMVVLPASHDQPFNAMRVRHHGLGEAIFPERETTDALESALLMMLSGRFERNLRIMQECFVACEAKKPSHRYMESCLKEDSTIKPV